MPSLPGKTNRIYHKSEEYGTLVIFTTLAPLAVGGLLGLVITWGDIPEQGIYTAIIYIFLVGLLALISSLFHLGRPWRAPLALLHLTTSWLSREVFFFGLFLSLTICLALVPILKINSMLLAIIGWAAVLTGLAATLASGQTYRLSARPSWDSWLTTITFPMSALSTGLLFGLFLTNQLIRNVEVAGYVWILAAFFLLASLIITWLRLVSIHPDVAEVQLSRQMVLNSYLWMLLLRIIAVLCALVFIFIGNGLQFVAWIPALIAEFIDRWLFFLTVIPVSLRTRYT